MVRVTALPHHHESSAVIAAGAAELFGFLDDPARLAGHMTRPSAMMGGGRMEVRLDGARAQAIGSHVVMAGSAFGFELFLD